MASKTTVAGPAGRFGGARPPAQPKARIPPSRAARTPGRDVLHDRARGGAAAHPPCRVREEAGGGRAAGRRGSAEDAAREACAEPRDTKGAAHPAVRAAGGGTHRQGDPRQSPRAASQQAGRRVPAAPQEPHPPQGGRLLARPLRDLSADRLPATPGQPVDGLPVGRRPAGLRSQGRPDAHGDAPGADGHSAAAAHHASGRLDPPGGTGACRVPQGARGGPAQAAPHRRPRTGGPHTPSAAAAPAEVQREPGGGRGGAGRHEAAA